MFSIIDKRTKTEAISEIYLDTSDQSISLQEFVKYQVIKTLASSYRAYKNVGANYDLHFNLSSLTAAQFDDFYRWYRSLSYQQSDEVMIAGVSPSQEPQRVHPPPLVTTSHEQKNKIFGITNSDFSIRRSESPDFPRASSFAPRVTHYGDSNKKKIENVTKQHSQLVLPPAPSYAPNSPQVKPF